MEILSFLLDVYIMNVKSSNSQKIDGVLCRILATPVMEYL